MPQRNTVVGKRQPLTKPQLAQFCIDRGDGSCLIVVEGGSSFVIDSVDAPRVMMLNWYAQPARHTVRFMAYAAGAGTPVQIGRYIAATPDDEFCDHIDGDATNNRRANLRNCSPRLNSANSHLRADKPIRFKGVTEYRAGRFRATGRSHGKLAHLGVAPTPEAAAQLYDEFARREFGEFARVNFPSAGERSVFREPANAE